MLPDHESIFPDQLLLYGNLNNFFFVFQEMVSKNLGIAIGRRKGYPTIKKVQKIPKPTHSRGFRKRNDLVTGLIYEIAGVSPYEARIMELMGNVSTSHSSEKRPIKFAKKRLGSLRRAKLKVKKIEDLKARIQRRQQDWLNFEAQKKKEPTHAQVTAVHPEVKKGKNPVSSKKAESKKSAESKAKSEQKVGKKEVKGSK